MDRMLAAQCNKKRGAVIVMPPGHKDEHSVAVVTGHTFQRGKPVVTVARLTKDGEPGSRTWKLSLAQANAALQVSVLPLGDNG